MQENLVKEWVDVTSDNGQRLIDCPNASFALYDPADHPNFDPLYWNTNQKGANCLGYALQAPSETLNPGFVVKGKDPEKYMLADVFNRAFAGSPSLNMDEFKQATRRGLEKDGLIKADVNELYRPGHYLIALCFTEIPHEHYKDFHFMVMNSNGQWSELSGAGDRGFVKWTDAHDEPVTNPARAFLGNDMSFDSFYHAPRGGASILREL